MANKITDTKYYGAIADAIRAKNGSQDTYYPADMAQAIEDLPSGGGDAELEALLAGTATGEVTVDGLEYLGATIYISRWMNSGVTILSFPDLISVTDTSSSDPHGPGITGADSTKTYMHLREINLPVCDCIRFPYVNGTQSNDILQTLEVINAPQVTRIIGHLAGSNIINANFPNLTSWSTTGKFRSCTNLEEVNMPKLTTVGANDFSGCTALTDIELPKALNMWVSNLFQNCTSLKTVKMPSQIFAAGATGIFQNDSQLESVDLGNSNQAGGTFGNNVFTGCTSLKTLILRYNRMNYLQSDTLTQSQIAAGNGYVYVPRDLVSTYQAATNWTVYSAQFRALEDYTVDGTIDGELDPTKI